VSDIRRQGSASDRQRHAVVLRVWAPRTPGYLRAEAYAFYLRGVWHGERPLLALAEDGTATELAPAHAFERPELAAGAAGPATWRVQPTGAFSGRYLPLPGMADRIEIVADELDADNDGATRATGWVRSSGYRVRAPVDDRGSAYPHLLAERTDTPRTGPDPYLAVPPTLAPLLARQLVQWQIPSAQAPVRARIEAVCLALTRHCSYRRNVAADSARDPVAQFLEGRQGQCASFASTAALLLRQNGIRTRYITGFLCEEPHPSRRYWVARGAAAHAWVEAYVPEISRWELVEATPADGRPGASSQFGAWERRWDPWLAAMRQAWGALRSGAAVQGLRQGVAVGVIWLMDRAVVLLGTAVILGATWLAWRVARGRRLTPAQRRRLNARRRRIDRRLSAAGAPRPWHCTLREGVMRATQLETEEREALLADVAAWERERYG
jgi:transglutaminase-like putative cysteine protease